MLALKKGGGRWVFGRNISVFAILKTVSILLLIIRSFLSQSTVKGGYFTIKKPKILTNISLYQKVKKSAFVVGGEGVKYFEI